MVSKAHIHYVAKVRARSGHMTPSVEPTLPDNFCKIFWNHFALHLKLCAILALGAQLLERVLEATRTFQRDTAEPRQPSEKCACYSRLLIGAEKAPESPKRIVSATLRGLRSKRSVLPAYICDRILSTTWLGNGSLIRETYISAHVNIRARPELPKTLSRF